MIEFQVGDIVTYLAFDLSRPKLLVTNVTSDGIDLIFLKSDSFKVGRPFFIRREHLIKGSYTKVC